ncbi:hypothetical protein SUGI_0643310 [Cryptomeria japonica]|nr:hypothetical protein SUGI_0643310 [Cryptomeria japonica]
MKGSDLLIFPGCFQVLKQKWEGNSRIIIVECPSHRCDPILLSTTLLLSVLFTGQMIADALRVIHSFPKAWRENRACTTAAAAPVPETSSLDTLQFNITVPTPYIFTTRVLKEARSEK